MYIISDIVGHFIPKFLILFQIEKLKQQIGTIFRINSCIVPNMEICSNVKSIRVIRVLITINSVHFLSLTNTYIHSSIYRKNALDFLYCR